MLGNLQGFQGKWKSNATGHGVFLFKKLVVFFLQGTEAKSLVNAGLVK